jgi:hypothetical protein
VRNSERKNPRSEIEEPEDESQHESMLKSPEMMEIFGAGSSKEWLWTNSRAFASWIAH